MSKPKMTPIVQGQQHRNWPEWTMGGDGRYEKTEVPTSETQAKLTLELAGQIADEQMRQLAEVDRFANDFDPVLLRETLRHAAEVVLER